MNKLPIHLLDAYKTGHHLQYPDKTESVYSNFTPRVSRIPQIQNVVTFGVQYFVKEYLIKLFNEEFFQKPKAEVVSKFVRRMNNALGPNNIGTAHLEALHDLGYLPIKLKALPEGTVSPIGVPVLTIKNTKPEFYWLTNFLETLASVSLWHPMTSATIAFEYRKLLTKYANQTSDMLDFVPWQGHDFSMRGQTSVESAMVSGAAHLLSFTGTDTIPSIDFLEEYYNANSDKELIGGSVPATEHSVMCMGGNETELQTFDRLITKVYPSGIVSIVSDTWDYWKVLIQVLPALKDKITARDGKVVIRPDSGDPVKIICGDLNADKGTIQYSGTVEYLYNTFGGTVNSKGFKQLDSHIGVIYGDSITLERAEEICKQLKEKGFASTNCVFGIGSYTYQHVTRDTFGFAMKATHGIIDGKSVDIYKDPVTDNGTKKSAKGLLRVNDDLTLSQQVDEYGENEGLLETVFIDGFIGMEYSLSDIRTRLLSHL
jgi:nicotinamide phosphoribosyltransferase